jgi:hypothetical protein
MTKFIAWIKHEAKALIAVFVYFLSCYGIIILLKKLILAHYNISYFGFGAAVLGAFISAKAVLVIDSTPLAKVLSSAKPYAKVLYDCFVYTSIALLLLYLEKLLELAHKEGNFRLAFFTVNHDDDLSEFAATVLLASLTFLGYAVFATLSRHLGHGELYRLFFTPPKKKDDDATPAP